MTSLVSALIPIHNGTSLKGELYHNNNWLQGVLIWFKMGKVALAGDMESMFNAFHFLK